MGRLIVWIVLFGSLAFIAIQIYRFFISINNSSGQRKRDLERLKREMSQMVQELVPMNAEELELLSVNQLDVNGLKGLESVKTGKFTSVYYEPLVAYAHKQYSYPADSSVLLVSTTTDNFVYESEGYRTTVYLNEEELGVIDADGSMYEAKTDRLLAHIEVDGDLSAHPVKVGEREVGEIVNLRLNASPNPRAYQLLEPMNLREKQLFKALTFLSLVEESVL